MRVYPSQPSELMTYLPNIDHAHKEYVYLNGHSPYSGHSCRIYHSVMSGLEQMRIFFRICQCTGLFPFRLELADRTKSVFNISFSWKYPITWWFITTIGVQVLMFYLILSPTAKAAHVNLPTILFVSITLSGAISFLTLITVRFWISPHFSSFFKAIELISKIERYLLSVPLRSKCTVTIRTVLGAISYCVMV